MPQMLVWQLLGGLRIVIGRETRAGQPKAEHQWSIPNEASARRRVIFWSCMIVMGPIFSSILPCIPGDHGPWWTRYINHTSLMMICRSSVRRGTTPESNSPFSISARPPGLAPRSRQPPCSAGRRSVAGVLVLWRRAPGSRTGTKLQALLLQRRHVGRDGASALGSDNRQDIELLLQRDYGIDRHASATAVESSTRPAIMSAVTTCGAERGTASLFIWMSDDACSSCFAMILPARSREPDRRVADRCRGLALA